MRTLLITFLVVLLTTTISNAQDGSPFVFGVDIPAVENGGTIGGTIGSTLEIDGFLTFTTTVDGVGGWTSALEVLARDGGEFCIEVETTEGFDVFNSQALLDSQGFFHIPCKLCPSEPPWFVIQGDSNDCDAGRGDPGTPENEGRRGIVESTVFNIGQSIPVGVFRILPLKLLVEVPDFGNDVTIELAYVDGLRGPGLPISNRVSFQGAPHAAASIPYSFTVRGVDAQEDSPWGFGFDIPQVANGGTLVANGNTTVEISGHLTLIAEEPGVGGLTAGVAIKSSVNDALCIDVSTVEEFFPHDRQNLLQGQGGPTGNCFCPFPSSYVIQGSDRDCDAGTVDPELRENAGQRGIIDSAVFNIGQSLPAGTFRTLSFKLLVNVPPFGQSVDIELEYVHGLRGPGQPVTNGVSANGRTHLARRSSYSFTVSAPPVPHRAPHER